MRLDNFVTKMMSRAISKACAISLKVVIATNSHLSENGMEWLKTRYITLLIWKKSFSIAMGIVLDMNNKTDSIKFRLARGVQPTLSILFFLLRKKSSITSTIHDICPSAPVQWKILLSSLKLLLGFKIQIDQLNKNVGIGRSYYFSHWMIWKNIWSFSAASKFKC